MSELRIAVIRFNVPADHFAAFAAVELGFWKKSVGKKEAAADLLCTNRVLWLQWALATDDQRDHRLTKAEQLRSSSLRLGPGHEVSEGGH